MKNFLYTNDESLRAHYEERWLAMSQEIREYTKVRSMDMDNNFQELAFTMALWNI